MPKKEKLAAFGAELRRRRDKLDIDQKVLAVRIGISPQHLSQIETAYNKGGRGPVGPSDDVVEGIARELGWRVIDQRRVLGQIPESDIELMASEGPEAEVFRYIRNKPPETQARALRVLEAMFDSE